MRLTKEEVEEWNDIMKEFHDAMTEQYKKEVLEALEKANQMPSEDVKDVIAELEKRAAEVPERK